eukprot:831830-Heterocapsa_arctica.AAC.1
MSRSTTGVDDGAESAARLLRELQTERRILLPWELPGLLGVVLGTQGVLGHLCPQWAFLGVFRAFPISQPERLPR